MAGYDNSIADVLKTAIQDAQDLVRGEIALARAEMREEVRRFGTAAAAIAAAAVTAIVSVVLLLTAAAWAISEILVWPVWSGFAIVGAVMAIAALVLGLLGRRRLAGERHMRLTVDTLKENMQWMRAQRS
ncbi:MAG TPA: phage holin family protein [Vicinamibacterales bacterium]|nr:phage holin family protein [Vicinamibacterales bacterium]